MELWRRRASVQVGTTLVEYSKDSNSLDFSFSIEKNISGNPNKAEIKILNLSQKHRAEIAKQKTFPVIVSAGHDERMTLIFRGDIRRVVNERDGNGNTTTTIEAQDGIDAHQHTRANLSFGKGAKVGDVIKGLANALVNNGAGIGNVVEMAASATLEGLGSSFAGGASFSGQASKELRKVTESAGLEYSIQDGNIQITKRGAVLGRTAIVLSPTTGLISSPVKDAAKSTLTAKALIIPDLLPGRQVKFQGTETVGFFRVIACKYSGSTYENDWYAEITCKEL